MRRLIYRRMRAIPTRRCSRNTPMVIPAVMNAKIKMIEICREAGQIEISRRKDIRVTEHSKTAISDETVHGL